MTVQDWFRSAPCGLVATTVDGEIVDANPTFLSWTGYPLDAVVGRPLAALLDPGSKLFFETRHSQIMHLRGEVHEVALTLVKADGTTMPSLINSTRDDDAGIIRTAVFNAAERIRYERELVTARRAAETSEERVRILQDVSTAFGVSATDEDVAESFASVARTAFAARETAVLLIQEDGELELVGGTNPLAGKVSPVPELRKTLDVAVVTAGPEERTSPRSPRRSALSDWPRSRSPLSSPTACAWASWSASSRGAPSSTLSSSTSWRRSAGRLRRRSRAFGCSAGWRSSPFTIR
nr:hypothetical protein GCM10025699_02400 [Microbacterium flavescens]